MHVVTAFFQIAMDGFSFIVTVVSVVSLISGCDFPLVWNAVFQEAEDPIYLALSLHIYEAVDGSNMLLLVSSKKQWMLLSICCHCTFN